jgi:hypothetical protein
MQKSLKTSSFFPLLNQNSILQARRNIRCYVRCLLVSGICRCWTADSCRHTPFNMKLNSLQWPEAKSLQHRNIFLIYQVWIYNVCCVVVIQNCRLSLASCGSETQSLTPSEEQFNGVWEQKCQAPYFSLRKERQQTVGELQEQELKKLHS